MKHSQGFTLIEALVVLVISSIIGAMATSSWATLKLRMEARSTITLLASSLSSARNTAISRQTPVTLCGSSNASTCDNLWQEGVLVFIDIKRIGKPSAESDILGSYRMDRRDAHITWKGFGSGSILRFDPSGRTSASNGSFTYCPANKESRYARQVVINRGGRVRFSLDRNGDGIHEDSSGNPLSCP